MLNGFLSRLVLRLFGLAWLGWTGLRLWAVFLLLQESGRWADVARFAALVLGSWSAFDGITAIALLALKNWARYTAFASLALHFAVVAIGYSQSHEPALRFVLAAIAGAATLLVLASKAEEPSQP